MNLEEIRHALGEALPMRPPRFEPGTGASAKIGALEDYLLESAFAHATLEEARHYLAHTIERLRREIQQLEGYEALLPRKAQDRITQADRDRAREEMSPELFDAGREAKLLLESVKRQIDRFEWEQTTISRAYTLISGG